MKREPGATFKDDNTVRPNGKRYKTSCRKFTAEFKSRICIEALKEQQTIEALAKKYDLHPTQINTWKKEALQNSSAVFAKEASKGTEENDQLIQAPYAQIGELKVAR